MVSPPKRSLRHLSPLRPARAPVDVEPTPHDATEAEVAPAVGAGQLFASRYRLDRPIARGGMGAIWAAYDTRISARIALKIVQFDAADEKNLRARFVREAMLAKQLRGRPFVEVFDHGIADQRAFIAMELLDGETLLERLRRAGALTPAEALVVLRGICAGLRVAHALQIVHRDLKPSNIFLARTRPQSSGVQSLSERQETVKILDFGIAKDTWDNARLTRPDVMLGSAFYMSPEQIQSGRDVDTRADLWSLAVIMFLGLTGKLPFRGPASEALAAIVHDEPPAPSSIAPNLPRRLDAFFARALQKRAAMRFETVDEMVAAFADAIHPPPGDRQGTEDLPVVGASASRDESRESVPCRDSRATIPALAAAFVSLEADMAAQDEPPQSAGNPRKVPPPLPNRQPREAIEVVAPPPLPNEYRLASPPPPWRPASQRPPVVVHIPGPASNAQWRQVAALILFVVLLAGVVGVLAARLR